MPVALALLSIPGKVFWPYCAGTVVLLIGLARLARDGRLRGSREQVAISLAQVFLAAPMAVFGADHFVGPDGIARIIPAWIPAHMFWVYFVGTALVAAALAIASGQLLRPAAALLGAMLLCFVVLMHLPVLATHLGNRFALAVLLRDLSFGSGALALAVAESRLRPRVRIGVTGLLRSAIGVSAVAFGIEHFLHPQFVPVIPLRQLLPAWIPAHLALSYTVGAALIAGGFALLLNWRTRAAAMYLGALVFAVVMLIYVPIMMAAPGDIASGLNYVADTLVYCGSLWLLAGAVPQRAGEDSPQRETVAIRMHAQAPPH